MLKNFILSLGIAALMIGGNLYAQEGDNPPDSSQNEQVVVIEEETAVDTAPCEGCSTPMPCAPVRSCCPPMRPRWQSNCCYIPCWNACVPVCNPCAAVCCCAPYVRRGGYYSGCCGNYGYGSYYGHRAKKMARRAARYCCW